MREIPWLTTDSIKMLEELFQKNPEAKVIEFGCGGSTIWMAQRIKNLITVEHDKSWQQSVQETLNSKKLTNVDLRLLERPYNGVLDQFQDEYFDLVLVDGRERRRCILSALRTVKSGGILMLDNAERSYYHCAFDSLNSWNKTVTMQTGPDPTGFWYENWQTTWWIKP